MSDRLQDIIQRIASGEYSEAERTALKQALLNDEEQTLNQLGKYNIKIGEGQNIYIGDRTFVEINDAAVQAIVAAIQSGAVPKTPAQIDFQPYLRSIVEDEDYRERDEVYMPTTVEGQTLLPQAKSLRLLKLQVETAKPQEDRESGDTTKTETREQIEQWDVLAGLRNYAAEHVLLIGKPGSGKSTSLERLLLEEANNALGLPNPKIPVLVKLRRCTSTIEQLIQDFFNCHYLPLEIADIKYLLTQGKLIILLDGLNELPEACRTEATNFRNRYRKTTSMIVSTRATSLAGTLGIKKALKMLPLTEAQMQEFVCGYLGEDGNHLFQQIKDDRLRKFAETPLLLWMLCRVFRNHSQIPNNLGLVFREFTQLYDQAKEESESLIELSLRDERSSLISHLAFKMLDRKEPTSSYQIISKDDALDILTQYIRERQISFSAPRRMACQFFNYLSKHHLIQLKEEKDYTISVEFSHHLIQEYYASEFLAKNLFKRYGREFIERNSKDSDWSTEKKESYFNILYSISDTQFLENYLNHVKWTEPIILMLGLFNDTEEFRDLTLRIVRMALENVDLLLGARLTGSIEESLQEQCILWIESIGIASLLRCQCWEIIGSSKVLPNLLKELQHDQPSVRKKAADALGNIGISSFEVIKALTIALNDNNSSVRWKASDALIRLVDNKNVELLISELRSEDALTRKYVAVTLGKLGNKNAYNELVLATSDPNSIVRAEAASALGSLGNENAISFLINLLKDEHLVRQNAIDALKNLLRGNNFEGIDSIIQLLTNEDIVLRDSAINILKGINSEYSVRKVAEKLKLYYKVPTLHRKWAAEALGQMRGDYAYSLLRQETKHSNDFIRQIAVEALGKFKEPEDLPLFLKLLKDDSFTVRRSAARAIREFGNKAPMSEFLIDDLLVALKDKAPTVRKEVIEALGCIGSTSNIPDRVDTLVDSLVNVLVDKNLEVRKTAIEALGKFNINRASATLLKASSDSSHVIRESAASALGKIADRNAFNKLVELFEDSETSVRIAAIKALSIFACKGLIQEEIVELFLKASRDSNSEIRKTAVRALINFDDENAISELINMVNDEDVSVRKSVEKVLNKLNKKFASHLLKAFDESSPDGRQILVRLFGSLASFFNASDKLRVKQILASSLKEREHITVKIAIESLTQMGCLRALHKATKIERKVVQEHARSVLQIAGGEFIIVLMNSPNYKCPSSRTDGSRTLQDVEGIDEIIEEILDIIEYTDFDDPYLLSESLLGNWINVSEASLRLPSKNFFLSLSYWQRRKPSLFLQKTLKRIQIDVYNCELV